MREKSSWKIIIWKTIQCNLTTHWWNFFSSSVLLWLIFLSLSFYFFFTSFNRKTVGWWLFAYLSHCHNSTNEINGQFGLSHSTHSTFTLFIFINVHFSFSFHIIEFSCSLFRFRINMFLRLMEVHSWDEWNQNKINTKNKLKRFWISLYFKFYSIRTFTHSFLVFARTNTGDRNL